MSNYVEVPAQAIEDFLQGRGFTRSVQGREVVYSRPHEQNSDVKVLVYTSIRVDRTHVRAVGKDSIRVCTVFNDGNRSFGVGKFPPIFRVTSVQSVLDRMLSAMRKAYARGSEWIAQDNQRSTQRFPSSRPQNNTQAQGGWE